jgi:hypothetical protein
VVVLTLRILVLDTAEPINFYIDALQDHSLPDPVPAYLDGADYNNIIALQQSTGGPDFPVATINGDCAVANEEATWSDVKAMFR